MNAFRNASFARGYATHGFFETFVSLAAYTRTDLFQRAGERTPVFVRLTSVAGTKGSADLARDIRGFAWLGQQAV